MYGFGPGFTAPIPVVEVESQCCDHAWHCLDDQLPNGVRSITRTGRIDDVNLNNNRREPNDAARERDPAMTTGSLVDERAGAVPVLILSYEFWKKQERGDPNIIGKKYQMNDRPHLVIGVLPAIPQYPNENDVYMTTTSCPFRMRPAVISNRDARMMRVF